MKKVICGVIFGLMASSAFAANPTYFGASVGRTTLEGAVAPSFSLVVGHEIKENDVFGVAFETGITKYGEFNYSESVGDGWLTADQSVDAFSVPVRIKPTVHMDKFTVAPYVGATYTYADVDTNVSIGQDHYSASNTVDHISFSYGLSAGYDVTSDVTVSLSYDIVRLKLDNDSQPARTMSVQVVQKF